MGTKCVSDGELRRILEELYSRLGLGCTLYARDCGFIGQRGTRLDLRGLAPTWVSGSEYHGRYAMRQTYANN
jgi:hypothetical protein